MEGTTIAMAPKIWVKDDVADFRPGAKREFPRRGIEPRSPANALYDVLKSGYTNRCTIEETRAYS